MLFSVLQLRAFAVRIRANVTIQPAAIIPNRNKITYFALIRIKNWKYTPKTAVNKAKNAAITKPLHSIAAAGCI